jgi:hypothetical protein
MIISSVVVDLLIVLIVNWLITCRETKAQLQAAPQPALQNGKYPSISKGRAMRLLSNSCWFVWTQPVFFVSRTEWLFPKPRDLGSDNPSREKHSFEIDR